MLAHSHVRIKPAARSPWALATFMFWLLNRKLVHRSNNRSAQAKLAINRIKLSAETLPCLGENRLVELNWHVDKHAQSI